MMRLLLLLPVLAFAATPKPGMLAPSSTTGQVVSLSWSNPTTNTDGSALAITDITQIRLTYGPCGGNSPVYQASVTGQFVGLGGVTHADSPPLPAGTYCFLAYTSANEGGAVVEGPATNVLQVSVGSAPPTGPVSTSPTVYMVVTGANTYTTLPVGTAPLGTPCIATAPLFNAPPYMIIPWAAVTYSGKLQPHAVITTCQ